MTRSDHHRLKSDCKLSASRKRRESEHRQKEGLPMRKETCSTVREGKEEKMGAFMFPQENM